MIKKRKENLKKRKVSARKSITAECMEIDHAENIYSGLLMDGGNGIVLRVVIRCWTSPYPVWMADIYNVEGQKRLATVGGRSKSNLLYNINEFAKDMRERGKENL